MKNLKIWQKLIVVGIVFALPFGIAIYKVASGLNSLGIEFAKQESRGLAYYRPLSKLLQDLQQHRGMTTATLSGDRAFKDRLAGKRSDIDNDVRSVHE